ncbi:MAG: hypothetical protein IPN44_01195 [Flavobacteriales bacterium]|nr:hypothetical protein [Flavobacteriales bacterium]
MKQPESFTLLNGCFTAQDAKEVLMSVFQAKIHFHQMQNFSSQERFGREDVMALKRIPELKKNLQGILEVIAQAAATNMKLNVTSEVNIEFTRTDQ